MINGNGTIHWKYSYISIGYVCPTERGVCVNSEGEIPGGVLLLDDLDNGNGIERQKQCLNLCRWVDGVTGCELRWGKDDKGCYAHTKHVVHAKDECKEAESGCLCAIFSKCKGRFGPRNLQNVVTIIYFILLVLI